MTSSTILELRCLIGLRESRIIMARGFTIAASLKQDITTFIQSTFPPPTSLDVADKFGLGYDTIYKMKLDGLRVEQVDLFRARQEFTNYLRSTPVKPSVKEIVRRFRLHPSTARKWLKSPTAAAPIEPSTKQLSPKAHGKQHYTPEVRQELVNFFKSTVPRPNRRSLASKFHVPLSTANNWIRASGATTCTHTLASSATATPAQAGRKPTFDDIIQAAPSLEAIGVLMIQGFIGKIDELSAKANTAQAELRAALDANARLSEDMKKLQDEFNSKLARIKIGTLTLDQLQHKLIPKQKGG